MARTKLLALFPLFLFGGLHSAFGQLAFPLRATFYYPWFPATWTVNGAHVFYQPKLGYYSSDNQAIIDQHIKAMDYANMNVAIASWWGVNQNSESTRIPMLLNRTIAAGSRLKWAVYYEKEGFANISVSQIQSDLAYVKQNYVSHPAYAHIDGKPVIFVYNADDNSCEVADRWAQATNGEWYVSLKVVSGYQGCAHQPSTWHQYGPNSPEQRHKGFSFVIAPGFWRADAASPLLARDPARWIQNVRNMVASKEPWQLITTFSEWGEGTAVEGAKDWESASGYGTYLDALHDNANPASIGIGKTRPDLPVSRNSGMKVYDLKGRLVNTLKNGSFGDYGREADKTGFARGVYLLKPAGKAGSSREPQKIAFSP
jgi:hypothetical protein